MCIQVYTESILKHIRNSTIIKIVSRSTSVVNCDVIAMARAKKNQTSVWEPSDKKSQRMAELRWVPIL